ncbi:MAG: ribulokinase [Armatimonadetes bacterium]|jgi:L-ribulokinase|nr:ribulokinase [Armatimonadota bacterium]
MATYSLGIDFGTLSARALLVDIDTGREVASDVCEYPHAVIDDHLPSTGEKLPPDWALQDPQDYLDALQKVVSAVMKQSKAQPSDVIGIGIDFTACTIMPIDKSGQPLCFDSRWASNPHAWVKLWKHHAAQPEASKINEIADARGEKFLHRYGGKVSSEWLFPKLLQILNEAPEIYSAADKFIEAGDWLTLQLTGIESRSACAAGYKAMWDKADGFPSGDFFRSLDPRFERVVDEKLSRKILPVGAKAGELTDGMAAKLGLMPGIAVAVAVIDAHVATPAATVTKEGSMVAIMGTSSCHMVLGKSPKIVEGISGCVEDGILPGYFGFEAGQSCVGDHFAWFAENCVPESYTAEARSRAIGIQDLLTEKASKLKPGQSGLLALDWWNGNRSVLEDGDLTGMILGMTLATRPEEIYRALIEATAYGTNIIIDSLHAGGVEVNEIIACGGLADKNEMLMQIYADVTNREFKVAESAQTCALGSAMWGAVAAGKSRGGYDTINEAVAKMARVKDKSYLPDPSAHAVYARLFDDYKKLHDYFGRGENDVMKRLKEMKTLS